MNEYNKPPVEWNGTAFDTLRNCVLENRATSPTPLNEFAKGHITFDFKNPADAKTIADQLLARQAASAGSSSAR